MEQIIENYISIFLLPVIFGSAMRISLRRSKRAHRCTGASILVAIVMWTMACIVPTHGSEGYGIIALMYSMFSVGMIFVELSAYILKKWRR